MTRSSCRTTSRSEITSTTSRSKNMPFTNRAVSVGCRFRDDENSSWFLFISCFSSSFTTVRTRDLA